MCKIERDGVYILPRIIQYTYLSMLLALDHKVRRKYYIFCYLIIILIGIATLLFLYSLITREARCLPDHKHNAGPKYTSSWASVIELVQVCL